jgi:prolyl oligopeptidase
MSSRSNFDPRIVDQLGLKGNREGMMDHNMTDDEFIWLEEIEGAAALDWVARQNQAATARLCDAQFEQDRQTLLGIYQSDDRIPGIVQRGPHVYNFWTDAGHKRGIWRRTTMESYRADAPEWETMLDLDALGAAEAVSWVWGGSIWRPGDLSRVLIKLSRGGADATEIREFDLINKVFLNEGFTIPEAKSDAAWIDADTLLVTSAHGGDVTDSGYARTVRNWARGTQLDQAPIIFAAERADVYAFCLKLRGQSDPGIIFGRALDFFRFEYFYQSAARPLQKLDLPESAEIECHHGRLLVTPKHDWEIGGSHWPTGCLLAISLEAFLDGSRDFICLFTPQPRISLQAVLNFKDHVILTLLDNVRARVVMAEAQTGQAHPVPGLPDNASLSAGKLAPDDDEADSYLLYVSRFLEPDSLLAGARDTAPVLLKQLRPVFDAGHLRVQQYHATADDGTQIPYFWVGPQGETPAGGWPTHLYGYGGFEVSLTPSYLADKGALWLQRGGAYVLANIRGGGEFGPAWHQAGIRAAKRVAQDDFAAVAADLARRGLAAAPKILGTGGSNGGLLTGNMLTRHGERFGAIICSVPLLDMRRYSKLLAGASWMAEYGNPDIAEEWDYLRTYSPYHLAEPGQNYPPIFLMTTKRDDRVHPGHARKMAAKLQAMGYDALYYEPQEGGHGTGADSEQRATTAAMFAAFQRQQLL